MRRLPKLQEGSDAKLTSTFETSCFNRILDCDTADDSNDHLDQSSALLLHDAELVDRPHEAKTFWLPAGACPTTSLEKIAKAVFDFHSKNLGHNQHLHPHQDSPDATPGSTPRSAAACNSKRWGDGRAPHGGMSPTVATSPQAGYEESGAEWWVQRRQEGRHEDLGMPFHWDKDEKMLDQEGVVVCPAVSTVTYLTEDGAPTVVVECRATERGVVDQGDIERALVSYPALFKHLAFDGGFLHGVPEQLMRPGHNYVEEHGGGGGQPEGQPEEGSTADHSSAASIPSSCAMRRRRQRRMRVTLLVNVWLSHKPKGVEPLPATIAAALSCGDLSAQPSLCFDRPAAFAPVSIHEEIHTPPLLQQEEAGIPVRDTRGRTMVIQAPLGPTLSLEMQIPTPQRLSMGDLKALHSFALVYREGCFPRVKARNKVKVGAVACAQDSKHSDGSACRGEHTAEHGRGGSCSTKGVTGGAKGDRALGRTRPKRKHDMKV